MTKIINTEAIKQRCLWVEKIKNIEGDFNTNSKVIEDELLIEVEQNGISSLLGHLRLCGNIPESIGHDTSAEKLYSKYTDALLALSYQAIGLKSLVIRERTDVADVEGFGKKFSFVADAKAFRMSRTAKNQKDFKVQAMDKWKYGKPYAMVVCPIYQLPSRNSQIYQQAITRNVCIFTYSHLSLLVRYADEVSKIKAENLLFDLLYSINSLNPSKNAIDYWFFINNIMLKYSKSMIELWQEEKLASVESIDYGKEEALKYLTLEREKIMKMSHQEALKELIIARKINQKIETISQIKPNELLGVT